MTIIQDTISSLYQSPFGSSRYNLIQFLKYFGFNKFDVLYFVVRGRNF